MQLLSRCLYVIQACIYRRNVFISGPGKYFTSRAPQKPQALILQASRYTLNIINGNAIWLFVFFLYNISSVIVMKDNLPLLTQYFDLSFFTVSDCGTSQNTDFYFPPAVGVFRRVSVVVPKPQVFCIPKIILLLKVLQIREEKWIPCVLWLHIAECWFYVLVNQLYVS